VAFDRGVDGGQRRTGFGMGWRPTDLTLERPYDLHFVSDELHQAVLQRELPLVVGHVTHDVPWRSHRLGRPETSRATRHTNL
jgi:hypothetical protein